MTGQVQVGSRKAETEIEVLSGFSNALQGMNRLDIEDTAENTLDSLGKHPHDSGHSTNLTGFAKRLAHVTWDVSNSQRR
jgi:hypothetical protein